ncbi:uncharacterized protein LOC142615192 isoform X2 [Castanea sativa]|uniref:uncharacterized protein LOC142615192 isoform X2 n=1 Tax=Castanea sativa TaxID=21020 RepID=UPI003F64CCDD
MMDNSCRPHPTCQVEEWALSRIGKLWRGHKAELKENYCKLGIPKEALLELSPLEVDDNQFHVLVEYWFSQKGMDLSKDNKERRAKQTQLHMLGSRSYAQTADSIANKNGKQIEKGEMYEVAYSHCDGIPVNESVEANINGTSSDEEDNSNNNKEVENILEGDSKED